MPRSNPLPRYCFHKQSGQAYVSLNGKQKLLGPYNSPESKTLYGRVIAEWTASGAVEVARGDKRIKQTTSDVSIRVLLDRYWQFATIYYVKPDGSPAEELTRYHYALRLLHHLYGSMNAADFGPKELKALREAMIHPLEWVNPESNKKHTHRGWARTVANHQINRIKRVFKWAVAEELIPASVHQALTAVDALRRGRTTARETERVRPVPKAMVSHVLGHLPTPIRAMVELEAITGARGGELCQMRGCDLDMKNPDSWSYSPATHKTQHHGHSRDIQLGKLCQEIIKPFLKPDPQSYLFSPAEWEIERRKAMSEARKTPLNQGNVPGTNRTRRPSRKPGERYDRNSYGKAVARACEAAFPPPEHLARVSVKTGPKRTRVESKAAWKARLGPEKWSELLEWTKSHRFSPHRLRHLAATTIALSHGVEAAGAVLGQKTISSTMIYADHQRELAAKVMGEIG